MKIALVTGAGRGLGWGWVEELLADGYKVILGVRNLQKLEEQLEQHPLNEHCFPVHLDVSSESSIREMASWIKDTFGWLDLVVNNAGVNPKDMGPELAPTMFKIRELNADNMLEVYRINSLAPLLMVKHLLESLQKSSRPLVVNISSWLGSVSQLKFGGHYGYVSSKNLLNVLNKSMAFELKPDGIISVNVNPGWVKTDMGGSKADFSPREAARNLIDNVVNRVSIEDTGRFINYDGTDFPW